MRHGWMAVAAGCALAGAAAAQADVPAAAPPGLSVMTYNVEGLPFPVRRGRAAAARRIAAQLAAMRAQGDQPHVVVLQEAFGPAQRAIGAAAGYPFVAYGPDAHAAAPDQADDADRAFAAHARHLKGEGDGKWAGSGLAILSDYPILAAVARPFPAWACAGLDCLANKGALVATVAVPGAVQPVAVVATHLNSARASGVGRARFTWAYLAQVRALGRFLAGALDPALPYVVAGDTNIGRSAVRGEAFAAMLAGLPRTAAAPVRTALATCLDAAAPCPLAQPREVALAFRHAKDWEAYAPGAAAGLAPVALAAPFGHDAAGRMLSDHIGYTAWYRLTPAAAR